MEILFDAMSWICWKVIFSRVGLDGRVVAIVVAVMGGAPKALEEPLKDDVEGLTSLKEEALSMLEYGVVDV